LRIPNVKKIAAIVSTKIGFFVTAYVECCQTEAIGKPILLRYAPQHWRGCECYPTNHVLIQERIGDAAVTFLRQLKYLEMKIEEFFTGNLFIEVWSNRKLATPGWFEKLQGDWLWYYFLNNDELYTVPVAALRRWAENNLRGYPLRQQTKREQLNDSWGYCVPIKHLQCKIARFAGPFHPKRGPPSLEAAPAGSIDYATGQFYF